MSNPLALLNLNARYNKLVLQAGGQDEVIVNLAPIDPTEPRGKYVPSTGQVDLDANLIPNTIDPTNLDLDNLNDLTKIVDLHGVALHEFGHVAHTRFLDDIPTTITAQVMDAALLLEEARQEHQTILHRPQDRKWLRAACKNLIIGRNDPNGMNIPSAAALICARVDGGTLEPCDTRKITDYITQNVDPDTYNKMRNIWTETFQLQDTDATGMFTLATKWVETTKHLQTPDPNLSQLIAQTCETTAHDALNEIQTETTQPTPEPKQRNTPGTSSDPDTQTQTETTKTPFWTERKPTPDEHAAAKRLTTALTQARAREKTRTTRRTPTPGRLRCRAAVTDTMTRALGGPPSTQLWNTTTRTPTPYPPLTIGLALDVSGSMSKVTRTTASLAWILAAATHHANGTFASVCFGETTRTLISPHETPRNVRDVTANASYENFNTALQNLETLLPLEPGNGCRLLIIISDGKFRATQTEYGQQRLQQLHRNGVKTLWFTPTGDTGTIDHPNPILCTTGPKQLQTIATALTNTLKQHVPTMP